MKKKIMSMSLVVTLMMSALVGCGSDPATTASATGASEGDQGKRNSYRRYSVRLSAI